MKKDFRNSMNAFALSDYTDQLSWYSNPMGIWDRLGNVIKSYLDDDDAKIFGRNSGGRSPSGDPDLDSAYDELNDYLNRDKAGSKAGGHGADSTGSGYQWSDGASPGSRAKSGNAVPEDLRPDFAELGVAFGASADECKAAYKKLLKIHHPDRHAGHEGNFKKATERTARINAAYDRIEKWRQQ